MQPAIEFAPYLPFSIDTLTPDQWNDKEAGEYLIGKTQVRISLGNLMNPKGAQAIVAPSASKNFAARSVGGTLYRSDAQETFLQAAQKVEANQYNLADIDITLFNKDDSIKTINKPSYLLTALTVSTDARNQFQVITAATKYALNKAVLLPTEEYNQGRVDKIAFPALATGVGGYLTADQSARAMMQAIHEFNNPDNLAVEIIILDDPLYAHMLPDFKHVAAMQTYLTNNLTGEMGKKQVCTDELLDHINLENLRNELYDSEKAYRRAYTP